MCKEDGRHETSLLSRTRYPDRRKHVEDLPLTRSPEKRIHIVEKDKPLLAREDLPAFGILQESDVIPAMRRGELLFLLPLF
ncbi:MAG TPA: hypothetical protein VK971_06605 [Thiohalobacter sp.]|nr:hypothetical protein [Thiohalobacter sp.]